MAMSHVSSQVSYRSQLLSRFVDAKDKNSIEKMHSTKIIVDIDGILNGMELSNA